LFGAYAASIFADIYPWYFNKDSFAVAVAERNNGNVLASFFSADTLVANNVQQVL
jgi:hypothetical protein